MYLIKRQILPGTYKLPVVLIFSPEQSLRLDVLCGCIQLNQQLNYSLLSLALQITLSNTTLMQKLSNNVRPFVWYCSHRRNSLRSQLAEFLPLAFLMISAPSGKWWWAKGDRWNCFHNLFKYVVDFSSPFKPSQQLQYSLARIKKEMFDFISFRALF